MNQVRAPDNSNLKKRALSEYKKGKKPKEIAEKIGAPYNTVKSWIARERKRISQEEKDAPSRVKDAPSKRKKGAPLNNRNAKGNRGGRAPSRNNNAETHGAYATIYWDSLEDDELELIDCMTGDEEEELLMQIQMFSVRERRLMRSIRRYKDMEDKNHGLAVKDVSSTKKTEDLIGADGESVADGKLKKETVTQVTKTEAVMNSIVALEAELTKVQRAKTKAIESLARLKLMKDKQEMEANRDMREADLHDLQKELLDAQIEHMDAQTDKLLGTNVDLEDTSEIEAEIYGKEGDSDEKDS